MKYDAKIDPHDLTTSHGLVASLVGSHKRVLDVGCANGQLAEFLQGQDNDVSGVELDADLAEVAKSRLQRVVVGDVEQFDLVAEFGPASVDVVVFADVLEHLKNPLAALRQARELLAEDGFVVASIPNIAHGAIRLALLQGRFEYRELGLLDDTHLRFFTRSSLDSLFRSAGFIVEEWRQTTAGSFDTEIPLSATDFSSEIVERIDRDRDSRTYQFVVRALPLGTQSGDQVVASELASKERELQLLRGEVLAIASALGDVPRPPVVGLLASGESSAPAVVARLRTAVALAELRRRLAGFVVRAYGLHDEPAETALVGEVARPLLPWNPTRSAQVSAEVEAVVALGGIPPSPGLQAVVDDLVRVGCPLYVVAPETPPWLTGSPPPGLATAPGSGSAGVARSVADPLSLIGRLAGRELLLQRADYLSVREQLPQTAGFVLGYLAAVDPGARARAAQALESIATRAGTDLVVIDAVDTLGSSPGRTLASSELTPLDLLATMAVAGLVVSDSPAMLALATGLARPALGVMTGEGSSGVSLPAAVGKDQVVGRLDELVALAPVATADPALAQRRDEVAGSLDLFFDDLAGELLSAGVRPLRLAAPQRLAELTDQVLTLESVNAGLRVQLAREQAIIANSLGRPRHQDQLGGGSSDLPTSGSERTLLELRRGVAEIERLQDEITAIYATRTMRTLQPARRIYARLRSRHR